MLRLSAVMVLAVSIAILLASHPHAKARDNATQTPRESLLLGCGDIPEVLDLLEKMQTRERSIQVYLDRLTKKKREISDGRKLISERLKELRSVQSTVRRTKTTAEKELETDIAQLGSVYAAMKPKKAAEIMGSLPPDFSAELLMRIAPDSGARILAELEPDQAAVLTTYMGARRVKKR